MNWKDILVLLLLGAIVVVILMSMIRPVISEIFGKYVEAPKQGETARFVRYLGCSIAMCAYGCGSDEVVNYPLEYEGNKVVWSCKQLMDEHPSWCVGGATTLCGPGYAFNFTFKEVITYHGNYTVNTMDTKTYGSCGFGESGWQTDASCIGRWAGNLIDSACIDCKNIGSVYYAVRPQVGALFSYTNGDECNARGDERPLGKDYNSFSGSLWVSQNYASINCEKWGYVSYEFLGYCNFNKDDTFWIWSIKNTQMAYYYELFGRQHTCGLGSEYGCPKLIVCDHTP
jgi:hypothetical protein